MRIAFAGASGTGKSTLARYVQDTFRVHLNPVGARSVAKDMGFVHPTGHPQAGEGNPYLVDQVNLEAYTWALGELRGLEVNCGPASPPGLDQVVGMAQYWGERDDPRPQSISRKWKVGSCRPLFQTRLAQAKIDWELANDTFVTDRTPLDDLAYAALHCREVVTSEFMERAYQHMRRYDAVFYCPFTTFCNLGQDDSRVRDMTYHTLYDALLHGLLRDYDECTSTPVVHLTNPYLSDRKAQVTQHPALTPV